MNLKRQIFEFIVDHHARWNYRPNRSEIRRSFSSLSDDVDLHLEQLEREGLLTLEGDGESILLTSVHSAVRTIRLSNSGHINGNVMATPDSVTIDLCAAGIDLNAELSAHVVSDDSMRDAGIRRGDIAILRTGSPIRGEIVAVEISWEFALRRYVIIKGIPHLLAENFLRPDLSTAFDTPVYGVLECVISLKRNFSNGKSFPTATKVNYQQDGGLVNKTNPLRLFASNALEVATPERAASGSQSRARTKKSKTSAADRFNHPNPKTKSNDRWPEPPSGAALNDASMAYATRRQRATCDEEPDRPYGSAFTEALAEFVAGQVASETSPTPISTKIDCEKESARSGVAQTEVTAIPEKIESRRKRNFLRV